MEAGADKLLGDNKDYSGYTGADALKSDIYAGALEMASADERVMTSIRNNVKNSRNVALAKGKAAIIEKMNAEKGESEAVTAMQEAIDDYYLTIFQNMANHWNSQLAQIKHHMDQISTHDGLSVGSGFIWLTSYNGAHDNNHQSTTWSGRYSDIFTITVEPINGEAVDVDFLVADFGSRESALVPHYFGNQHKSKMENQASGFLNNSLQYAALKVGYQDPNSDQMVSLPFKGTRNYDSFSDPIGEAWASLVSERDEVNSQLSGFVSDVYAEYDPGEIPTEELVDPITASTELSQNYDGMQAQGVHAAMLGISTNADFSVQMTLLEDNSTVWADIYTEHVPTDDNGNEVGFQSGQTYSPSTWSDPLYIAYEYDGSASTTTTDGNTTSTTTTTTDELQSDFVQIEQDFRIEFVVNKDGEEVTSFQTESRNNQTSDVTALENELAQIREAQLEMQKEAQNDGGGGFDFGSISLGPIPGEGVVLLAVAAAAWLKGS
ncbi:hypothetical protein [Halorussus halobius]|uniref:hypothetical protein n=1 Tax=Halorussus halobius TaxID=1710537 RepID=UPI0010933086|nr:hypothetical protein [Halorussus halobius]